MALTDEIEHQWYRSCRALVYAITSVYVLENACLLGLSFVSSSENYGNCYIRCLSLLKTEDFGSHSSAISWIFRSWCGGGNVNEFNKNCALI
jgi:hypothetical protein